MYVHLRLLMSYVCDLFFIFTFIFIVHNLIKTDTPAFLHIL